MPSPSRSQPPTDDERVSRKVVYETTEEERLIALSPGITIIIVVLALVLIGYILVHLHR